MKTITALILMLFALAGPVPPLLANWVEDGAPISTTQGPQTLFEIISTDSGGSILAWLDNRTASGKVYVQRLDASGAAMWTPGGIAVDIQGLNQSAPRIASDGAGGVIVAWQESVIAWDIFAQRIDADGNILWSPGGEPICTENSIQVDCQIIADGAGGAIVTWRDHRTGGADVYAQRITGAGSIKWTPGGVPVCELESEKWNSQLTSDGAEGAIVTWRDLRSGDNDIYVQRFDSLGAPLWGPEGVALCVFELDQTDPQIISDGAGGAIVTWSDARSGESDIYGQRVNGSGSPQWAPDGESLCIASGDQSWARIIADGLGGGIVSWSDFRDGNQDIYAQRVNPFGEASWVTDGVPVCTSYGDQVLPEIVSDGAHGAIVTWGYEIQAQRINPLGVPLWDTNGVTLCSAPGTQKYPRIASDGAGGAIVAWTDERVDPNNDDVYAQQIDALGRVGRVLPVVHSVADVPGDEGGLVNLAWDASLVDYRMGEVTEYSVWRALPTPAALGLLANGSDETPLRTSTLNGETFYWQLVSSLAAYRLQGYSELVPTLFDSTAVAGQFHYFQVIAHTNDPAVFWISEPDSGYSVDNLAPGALIGLKGHQLYGPEGLLMTWAPNTEPDLSGYRLYRGSNPDFPIDQSHLLATVTDTTMTDGGWEQALGFHYKVAAVDIHGNIGPPGLLLPDGVSGVDDPVPHATSSLAQNYPNPFNPSTQLSFEIDTPNHVVLKVYDTAGRLVTTLVDEYRGPGSYRVIWDGLDDQGQMASAGVYLYRLESGAFTETKRMTLIK